jgi:hypothetical protein
MHQQFSLRPFNDRFVEQHAIPRYLSELQQHRHQAVSRAGNEERDHVPAMPHAIPGGQQGFQVHAERPDEIVLSAETAPLHM